ncbi:MAG: hypothetical protein U1E26_04725 [Coriobacteriia bacterium]|nr:hypothetical protein [Coriobacteriia bacterium]
MTPSIAYCDLPILAGFASSDWAEVNQFLAIHPEVRTRLELFPALATAVVPARIERIRLAAIADPDDGTLSLLIRVFAPVAGEHKRIAVKRLRRSWIRESLPACAQRFVAISVHSETKKSCSTGASI